MININKYNLKINDIYKNYILLVDRGSYDSIIKTCLISYIFNKEKKLVPIILHHTNLTNKKKIFISCLELNNFII